jgi:hypothetical protein
VIARRVRPGAAVVVAPAAPAALGAREAWGMRGAPVAAQAAEEAAAAAALPRSAAESAPVP